MDRSINADVYPFLFYPQLFVLDGGFRKFFPFFGRKCCEGRYLPMLHGNAAERAEMARQFSERRANVAQFRARLLRSADTPQPARRCAAAMSWTDEDWSDRPQ
jgi:hypothetical protein